MGKREGEEVYRGRDTIDSRLSIRSPEGPSDSMYTGTVQSAMSPSFRVLGDEKPRKLPDRSSNGEPATGCYRSEAGSPRNHVLYFLVVFIMSRLMEVELVSLCIHTDYAGNVLVSVLPTSLIASLPSLTYVTLVQNLPHRLQNLLSQPSNIPGFLPIIVQRSS